MKRLLLTGAAGSIGSVLRKKLAPLAEILRVSDINDLGDAAPNEEIVYCDLSNEDDVYKLVEGCNGIVHFGGISIEKPWSSIRPANIEGVLMVAPSKISDINLPDLVNLNNFGIGHLGV